jgi:uncharacterized membrane protein YfcA
MTDLSIVIICLVAFLASGLTFFSGFGLGTLLLPAFALFYPVEQAIALTAVVHFLNGLFKLVLVGRFADKGVLLRFGLPAIAASFAGAWALVSLAGVGPLFEYSAFGRTLQVMPVSFLVGALLFCFAVVELVPALSNYSFPPKYLAVGGAFTGFFGGLSGMQGALRSAFLARSGLGKEAFIATGAVIASLIDISRLAVYLPTFLLQRDQLDHGLLLAAVLSAFAGAWLGSRYLKKVTLRGVQRVVAAMLFAVSLGLISGAI